MKNKRRYVVRMFNKNKQDDIYLGDEVLTACYRGVVIGWTDPKIGQYKVLVENGDIEDWVNPDKGSRSFEFYDIADLMKILLQLRDETEGAE